MKILFLDIDGVLLSSKAWILPANASLRHSGAHTKLREIGEKVVFDPCAVALVNRLCERTGARIVVHSNWRKTIGLDLTRRKLVEQGIDESLFHENWACSMRLSSEKEHEILWWLDDNRKTPPPVKPEWMNEPGWWIARGELSDSQEQEKAAYDKACNDYGILAIGIDDQFIGRSISHIKTDFHEGFSISDYRKAITALEGDDKEMGVYPLDADDASRVAAAFNGNKMAAIEWLTEPQHGRTRSARLNRESLLREAKSLFFFGYGGKSPEDDVERIRQSVWNELDEEISRRKETVRSGNGFNDEF